RVEADQFHAHAAVHDELVSKTQRDSKTDGREGIAASSLRVNPYCTMLARISCPIVSARRDAPMTATDRGLRIGSRGLVTAAFEISRRPVLFLVHEPGALVVSRGAVVVAAGRSTAGRAALLHSTRLAPATDDASHPGSRKAVPGRSRGSADRGVVVGRRTSSLSGARLGIARRQAVGLGAAAGR